MSVFNGGGHEEARNLRSCLGQALKHETGKALVQVFSSQQEARCTG